MDGIKLAGGGRLLNVGSWSQFFDLQGQPAPARTVNNITLRNISGEYRSFGRLTGNPGDVLRDITLENVRVQLKESALEVGVVENFVMWNVIVNGKEIAAPPSR